MNKLSKGVFKNKEIYIIDERIPKTIRRDELYYYNIRHSDDDFSEPSSIEEVEILCNFWGIVVTKEDISDILVDPLYRGGKQLILDDEESEELLSIFNYAYSSLENQDKYLIGHELI